MHQQLEQQQGHLLLSKARDHRCHHCLPPPLSWGSRAQGTEMPRGKGGELQYLAEDPPCWDWPFSCPQKVCLAISFPPLLPAKLTAPQGRSIQWVTPLHYTAISEITVSLFSYRHTQSAFPRSTENQIHCFIYHSSIHTGHDGLAVHHSSQPPSVLKSLLQTQKGPTILFVFRFSLGFKEKILPVMSVFKYQRMTERGRRSGEWLLRAASAQTDNVSGMLGQMLPSPAAPHIPWPILWSAGSRFSHSTY